MICERCEAFFKWVQSRDSLSKSHDARHFHYYSYTQWKQGAAQGCPLCIYLHPFFSYSMESLFDDGRQPILAWLPEEWPLDAQPPSGENTDIYLLANVATLHEPLSGGHGAGGFW